jgi:XapX domain-containing protein
MAKGSLEINSLHISFVVGSLVVGVLDAAIQVKTPAPQIIALLGLSGIVLGEQGGRGFLRRRSNSQMWLPLTLLESR